MTSTTAEKPERPIEDTLLDEDMGYYFKTMKDTKEIYHYNQARGIYVNEGEIIIQTQAEGMKPDISTHRVNEIMNHIRRRTYTNRDEFDFNKPEILNLQNGLLNIDTLV